VTRWGAIVVAVLRESRAARGRLLFFVACLAIGVAAVVGVSALISAMEAGLRGQSRELLTADLSVSARRPLPEQELAAFFAGVAHERVDVRELAAMASRPASMEGEVGESRLVELKVVDGDYPLYGELVLAPAGSRVRELGEQGVFVGSELLAGLGLSLGDSLNLGNASFRILAEVLDEPDRLDFAMTLGPRVFLSRAGLERTDLMDVRNRVRYTSLYALARDPDAEELKRVVADLERALGHPDYLAIRPHTEAQRGVRVLQP
jgi:putative ABC transport system permease protein